MVLRYTFQSAKLAYQQSGEGRQTEPMLHCDGEHLCVRIDKTTGSSRKVAQRDDALLLPNKVQKNWKEVVVAIKQELETWVKHGCVSRRKRTDAQNVIDVKRVIKLKIGPDARSAQESQQTGTSQRYSQRVLVSVAVQSQWDICTTDISKAFLQWGHLQGTSWGHWRAPATSELLFIKLLYRCTENHQGLCRL